MVLKKTDPGLPGVRRLVARIKWKLDRKKRWVANLRREAAVEHEATRARLEAELDSIRRQANERIAMLESEIRSHERRLPIATANVSAEFGRHMEMIGLLERVLTESIAPIPAAPTAPDSPEVSVVMPVYNRAGFVAEAIDSVIMQSHGDWELLIVDDGSEDDLAVVVTPYLRDPRIRFLRRPHHGAAAARNAALRQARGAFVAYLDSDNLWAPHFLSQATAALRGDPDIDLVYGVLSSAAHNLGERVFLFRAFDRQALSESNYVDLNVVMHRAGLFQRFGGFDESLDRLVDWDLVLRYTEERPARGIPVLAARYRVIDSRRISDTAPFWPNATAIRDKHYPPARLRRPLRVLYVVWHYPQLSETYIETEIRRLRRWGVHIEVWRAGEVASPYPTDTPIHSGSLDEAVRAVRPDLIQVHWLGFALQQADTLAALGVPITLRMHGFDVTPDAFFAILDKPWIRGVYAFPAQIALLSAHDERAKAVPAAFDSTLFRPGPHKDRRLVVRIGSALKSKDIGFFFDLAKRLPEFRFVYCGVTCKLVEAYAEEVRTLREQTNAPVEVRFDVPREEIAALMGRTGIHLHTACPPGAPHATPLGMPVSIAEGMATGAYTLARNTPEFRDYLDGAGAVYNDLDEAERLIRATLDWSDKDWRAAQRRSVERAFAQFADSMVYRTIFEDWTRIADEARESVIPANCR